MNNWINEKLAEFFDKTGERHIDMEIFKEIFDKLETPEYKLNQPELYESELRRIRDLHNSFTFAFEKGIEKRRIEGERKNAIKIAKKMIKYNEAIEKIMDYTGLTKKEIENLKP